MIRVLKLISVLAVGVAAASQRKRMMASLVHVLTKLSGTWVGSPNG